MTLEEYNNKNNKNSKASSNFKKFIIKCLFVVIIVFGVFLCSSYSEEFKKYIKEKVFNNQFNFSKINELYNRLFVKNNNDDTALVNKENIYNFSNAQEYENGYSISIQDNEAVKLLGSGVVVFIGEKEKFGKTLIMQQSNGIDVWYGNLKEVNVTMYDYLSKDTIIASSNDKLYLKFVKDGEYLNYKDI